MPKKQFYSLFFYSIDHGLMMDLNWTFNFYDGLAEIDISDYEDSSEWDLLGHSALKEIK